MTPTIGRVVHVRGIDPTTNNGATEAPAIITRVWSHSGTYWTVNVKALLDAPGDAWFTSIYLYDDPDTAPPFARHAVWPPLVR